ncbi:hypothetical protein PLICRDRAFT_444609 [Plicaturopsis crispa FD-325 SS-3]|uniref:Secreted protein n=1 Tax=Plicaturopsis crispa FD-325 SS-3 TaxID=944288 RepID=A0A0C9SKE5_PLICR|nr:hypothetical protein PLICRDRAFT_444609 [Plicaturopsis crispa FD-325 SS-3]
MGKTGIMSARWTQNLILLSLAANSRLSTVAVQRERCVNLRSDSIVASYSLQESTRRRWAKSAHMVLSYVLCPQLAWCMSSMCSTRRTHTSFSLIRFPFPPLLSPNSSWLRLCKPERAEEQTERIRSFLRDRPTFASTTLGFHARHDSGCCVPGVKRNLLSRVVPES